VTLWGAGEVHTGFWWGNPRDKDHLEIAGVEGKKDIKTDLHEMGWRRGLD
jgi:hypothetical protein